MNIKCEQVTDKLGGYHPFSTAFRQEKSRLYQLFSPFNPIKPREIVEYSQKMTWAGDRDTLARQVGNYLEKHKAPAAALCNAEKLARKNTWVIAAGHQSALFAGPFFITLKILTVLRVCQQLNEQTAEIEFLPLFWNASEDHNESEFNQVQVFDAAHDLKCLRLASRKERVMAGSIDAGVAQSLLEELETFLPETEYKAQIIELLQANMSGSLGASASRILLQLFGSFGLLVVEPYIFRSQSAEIFANALCLHSEVCKAVQEDTDEIRNLGYQEQMQVLPMRRTLLYFVADNQVRQRIRFTEDEGICQLEKSGEKFSLAELLTMIKNHPQKFSPAAGLRPIIQAAVLPCSVYVAGGGELAYHLQIRRLFKLFTQNAPLLLPRAAATVVKKSAHKLSLRFGITGERLISPWQLENVMAELLHGYGEAENSFNKFYTEADACASQLKSGLGQSGLSSYKEVEREYDKFSARMRAVQKRLLQEGFVDSEVLRRQYYKLHKFILPCGSYQELSIWSVYFLTLFGPEFIPAVKDVIQPFNLKHHLLFV